MHCFHQQVEKWISALLFSVETQETIGYGHRAIEANCVRGCHNSPAADTCWATFRGVHAGFNINKSIKASESAKTVMFSKSAVISLGMEKCV